MPRQRTYEQRYKRLLKESCVYSPARYQVKKVQPKFNEMIRAEAGAFVGVVPAVVKGIIWSVYSPLGYCVCVTCGTLHPWKCDKKSGKGKLDAGHFLSSDRIALEESNCHPQCVHCNRDKSGSGSHYRLYMETVYGAEAIQRLYRIAGDRTYQTPLREVLIERRIEFEDRTAAAVEKMR